MRRGYRPKPHKAARGTAAERSDDGSHEPSIRRPRGTRERGPYGWTLSTDATKIRRKSATIAYTRIRPNCGIGTFAPLVVPALVERPARPAFALPGAVGALAAPARATRSAAKEFGGTMPRSVFGGGKSRIDD